MGVRKLKRHVKREGLGGSLVSEVFGSAKRRTPLVTLIMRAWRETDSAQPFRARFAANATQPELIMTGCRSVRRGVRFGRWWVARFRPCPVIMVLSRAGLRVR